MTWQIFPVKCHSDHNYGFLIGKYNYLSPIDRFLLLLVLNLYLSSLETLVARGLALGICENSNPELDGEGLNRAL